MLRLCARAGPIFENEPRCLFIQSPVYVFGDIHGNLEVRREETSMMEEGRENKQQEKERIEGRTKTRRVTQAKKRRITEERKKKTKVRGPFGAVLVHRFYPCRIFVWRG